MEKSGGAGRLVRIELAESRDLEVRLRLSCWAVDGSAVVLSVRRWIGFGLAASEGV